MCVVPWKRTQFFFNANGKWWIYGIIAMFAINMHIWRAKKIYLHSHICDRDGKMFDFFFGLYYVKHFIIDHVWFRWNIFTVKKSRSFGRYVLFFIYRVCINKYVQYPLPNEKRNHHGSTSEWVAKKWETNYISLKLMTQCVVECSLFMRENENTVLYRVKIVAIATNIGESEFGGCFMLSNFSFFFKKNLNKWINFPQNQSFGIKFTEKYRLCIYRTMVSSLFSLEFRRDTQFKLVFDILYLPIYAVSLKYFCMNISFSWSFFEEIFKILSPDQDIDRNSGLSANKISKIDSRTLLGSFGLAKYQKKNCRFTVPTLWHKHQHFITNNIVSFNNVFKIELRI